MFVWSYLPHSAVEADPITTEIMHSPTTLPIATTISKTTSTEYESTATQTVIPSADHDQATTEG